MIGVVLVTLYHKVVTGDDDLLVEVHVAQVETGTQLTCVVTQLIAERPVVVMLAGLCHLNACHGLEIGIVVIVAVALRIPIDIPEIVARLVSLRLLAAVVDTVAPYHVAEQAEALVDALVVYQRGILHIVA